MTLDYFSFQITKRPFLKYGGPPRRTFFLFFFRIRMGLVCVCDACELCNPSYVIARGRDGRMASRPACCEYEICVAQFNLNRALRADF